MPNILKIILFELQNKEELIGLYIQSHQKKVNNKYKIYLSYTRDSEFLEFKDEILKNLFIFYDFYKIGIENFF